MTQEEKAKAYDKIMNRAKKELDACGSQDCDAARQIFRLFPELMGSEDKRIRKKIIATIHLYYGEPLEDEAKEMIAWLERQAQKPADNQFTPEQASILDKHIDKFLEQKPAEWNEEDEINLGKAIWYVENPAPMVAKDSMLVEWLKNLRGRVQPQPKQEWNEENEKMLECAIDVIEWYSVVDKSKSRRVSNWLKSLRPYSQWKPSDEQMAALDDFIYAKYPNIEKHGAVVKSLYQDLKKLKQ